MSTEEETVTVRPKPPAGADAPVFVRGSPTFAEVAWLNDFAPLSLAEVGLGAAVLAPLASVDPAGKAYADSRPLLRLT